MCGYDFVILFGLLVLTCEVLHCRMVGVEEVGLASEKSRQGRLKGLEGFGVLLKLVCC